MGEEAVSEESICTLSVADVGKHVRVSDARVTIIGKLGHLTISNFAVLDEPPRLSICVLVGGAIHTFKQDATWSHASA